MSRHLILRGRQKVTMGVVSSIPNDSRIQTLSGSMDPVNKYLPKIFLNRVKFLLIELETEKFVYII